MKKLILSLTAIALCVALAGCGNAIATKDNGQAIYGNMLGTQQSLLNEEYVKTAILSRTAKVKNHLSKEIKLSKAQSGAVKELTNS